jgi:hypothetical protein
VLAKILRDVTEALFKGVGFRRLCGLDTTKYTEADRVIMYLGIASYIGDERAPSIGKKRGVGWGLP